MFLGGTLRCLMSLYRLFFPLNEKGLDFPLYDLVYYGVCICMFVCSRRKCVLRFAGTSFVFYFINVYFSLSHLKTKEVEFPSCALLYCLCICFSLFERRRLVIFFKSFMNVRQCTRFLIPYRQRVRSFP